MYLRKTYRTYLRAVGMRAVAQALASLLKTSTDISYASIVVMATFTSEGISRLMGAHFTADDEIGG